MKPASRIAERYGRIVAATLAYTFILVVAATKPASAVGCSFEAQGAGRVTIAIDARTFRLEDGREVRLAGIESATTEEPNPISALSAIITGHDVTLHGEDDTPDRYGRQPAFVFLASSETTVQALLLSQGEALVSGAITNKDCASILTAAEAAGRKARKGIWANPAAIKNAGSPGDILTGIGQFTVVEGKVLSVRQSGSTTYLNFGRSWTRDFAVTIPRRTLSAFEAAGIVLKSLENRRVRVRGWVEARGGPRIEVLQVGQIELLGEN